MFQKWCQTTSFNGISDLYEARSYKPHFAFWLVVMVGAFSMSIWFTYRTIQGYIDTPTVTSVTAIDKPFLTMPEVSVCYKGGLNASAMMDANFSDYVIQSLQMSLNYETPPSWDIAKAVQTIRKYVKDNDLTVAGLVDKFSYKCEDVVSTSVRPGFVMPTGRCENITNLLTSDGNCFVFYNNGKQMFPGLWGGLKLDLVIPNNSFVAYFPELAYLAKLNFEFSISLDSSLQRQISKRSILIPANSRVEITLNPKHNIRLDDGVKCSNNPNEFTSNSCHFKCWLDEVERTQGCIPIDLFTNLSLQGQRFVDVCFPFIYPTKDTDLLKLESCNKACVPKCDEWITDAVATYSNWDMVRANGTRSAVAIGYSTMQYIEIQEVEAFTLDMAIANVGGQSGLWIGASIVTFVHAVFYFILACWNALLKPGRKNDNVEKSNFDTGSIKSTDVSKPTYNSTNSVECQFVQLPPLMPPFRPPFAPPPFWPPFGRRGLTVPDGASQLGRRSVWSRERLGSE